MLLDEADTESQETSPTNGGGGDTLGASEPETEADNAPQSAAPHLSPSGLPVWENENSQMTHQQVRKTPDCYVPSGSSHRK